MDAISDALMLRLLFAADFPYWGCPWVALVAHGAHTAAAAAYSLTKRRHCSDCTHSSATGSAVTALLALPNNSTATLRATTLSEVSYYKALQKKPNKQDSHTGSPLV
jgi:hypothetical protein